MKTDTRNMLHEILEEVSHIDYVHADDIPNIDLYMDQVTTFMDEQLKNSKRHEDDKILTKTMINNYAKNHLLPPPEKKKYSKEQVLIMTFIYYFKNILSIKDIETLSKPLTDRYFGKEEGLNITQIYQEICDTEIGRMDDLGNDILDAYKSASRCFTDAPEDEREYLQVFTFICNLIFDVYVKKQIIERIIDTLPDPEPEKGEKK